MKKDFLFLPLALPFFILLLLLPFLLLAIVALLNVAAGVAVSKILGFSLVESLLLYLAILFGSVVNIPLYEFKSTADTEPKYVTYMGAKYQFPVWHGHKTLVAINLGGCIIPALISIYFLQYLPFIPLLLTIFIVSLVVYATSQPVRSVGISVPVLIPPVIAVATSFIALYTCNDALANLARMSFVSGVFGTIIGADLLHIRDIHKMGANMISIGGAGSFDGIFLTGVIATLIAAIVTGI